MRSYQVNFFWHGQRYTQSFQAGSVFAARQLVESMYPGCSIWTIKAV